MVVSDKQQVQKSQRRSESKQKDDIITEKERERASNTADESLASG